MRCKIYSSKTILYKLLNMLKCYAPHVFCPRFTSGRLFEVQRVKNYHLTKTPFRNSEWSTSQSLPFLLIFCTYKIIETCVSMTFSDFQSKWELCPSYFTKMPL